MNLNKAMIIGNLTREPELKSTQTGKTVASFGVATNMVWNDQQGNKQEKAEFHNITVWGKLADVCGKYLNKGSKVYLEGRLQTNEWIGEDKVKRYKTEIIAENMIMLDSKPNTQNTPENSTTSTTEPVGESEPLLSEPPF